MISKIAKGAFLIVAVITILEFLFVSGMFTSLIVMFLSLVAGLVNVGFALKEKNYNEVGLYIVATIALCMGYWSLMFM